MRGGFAVAIIRCMSAGHATRRPFLFQLCAEDAAELQRRAALRRFEPGSAILHSGAASETAAVVLSGRVKITEHRDRARAVMVGICAAGELIGELTALDGQPREAAAVALEPVTAAVMAGCEFRAFLAERPAAALAVMRVLAQRLREADQARVEYALGDLQGRLVTTSRAGRAARADPSRGRSG
jgi:CRP-like cAMP-binding protein